MEHGKIHFRKVYIDETVSIFENKLNKMKGSAFELKVCSKEID